MSRLPASMSMTRAAIFSAFQRDARRARSSADPTQEFDGDFQLSGRSSHRDLVRPEAEQRALDLAARTKTNGGLVEAAVQILMSQDSSKAVEDLS